MIDTRRIDPYMSYRFIVIIGEIIQGGCNEISGLEVTTQVEDYREGGINNYVHKLPKETTFGNLTLKKGIGDHTEFFDWHKDVVNGNVKRKDVEISLLNDRSDQKVRSWFFKGAYPVKWTGPDLKADSNAVAFETLELVHHGYQS